MNPLLLLSLHDVAPLHLERLRRAEAVLQALGVHKVLYLFVANYHGRYPAAEHPEFVAWCRSRRDFTVQWGLHGYFHQNRPLRGDERHPLGWTQRLGSRLFGSEPDEFKFLTSQAQAARLDAALEMFRRCLGIQPAGFVPPGWAANPSLLPLLAEKGIPFAETAAGVWRPSDESCQPCRAIRWSSRHPWRRMLGQLGTRVLLRWEKESPVLRLALHPEDFDSPEIEDAIRDQVRTVLRSRVAATWSDLPAFRGRS